jgi:hypothetical protein
MDNSWTDESLDNQLTKDIERFKKNLGENGSFMVDDFIENAKKMDIQLLVRPAPPSSPDYFKNYYQTNITESSQDNAKLWIRRQALVYEVFRQVRDRFPKWFHDATNKKVSEESIIDNLNGYTYGIFGSMKYSSDVDIGIVPSEKNNSSFGVGDVIWYIENKVFIEGYGFSSLNIDIEYYASMLQYNGNYLLDVHDLVKGPHYNQLVQLALAGVYRNMMKQDAKAKVTTAEVTTKQTISGFLEERLSGISGYLPEDKKVYELNGDMKQLIDIDEYTEKSEKYKDLSNEAEKRFNELKQTPEDKDQRYNTIIALAKADLCREESYVLTPTVLHVVRILQSEEDETRTDRKPIDFNCKYPSPVASCAISGYGFLLSALEQYGYCKRFEVELKGGVIARKKQKHVKARAKNKKKTGGEEDDEDDEDEEEKGGGGGDEEEEGEKAEEAEKEEKKEEKKEEEKEEEVKEVAEEPNAKKYEKYENRLMDALRRCVRPFKLDELSQGVIKGQTRCPPPVAQSDDSKKTEFNAIQITLTNVADGKTDTQTVPIKK